MNALQPQETQQHHHLQNETKKTNAPLSRWQSIPIATPRTLSILRKRKQLPKVYCQPTLANETLLSLLSSALLRRYPSRPFRFIKRDDDDENDNDNRIREFIPSSREGVDTVVHWEIPPSSTNDGEGFILTGPIRLPVVLVLSAVNANASANSDSIHCRIQSALMKRCADRGWIAAGIEMRNDNDNEIGHKYLHDLRDVVNRITARMTSPDTPLILISLTPLTTTVLVEYLGREGVANTLSASILGAFSFASTYEPTISTVSHMSQISIPFLNLIVSSTDNHPPKHVLDHESAMIRFCPFDANPNLLLVLIDDDDND